METDNYLMYLRKSRADDPSESLQETLSKHESILQSYAEKKFGNKIPEANIFREIVSGETIEDRPMIRKILSMIESEGIFGVLVVDPQRLTRGDMIDCGTIINAFKYSGTMIVTPSKSFDLSSRDSDFINYDEKILKMELSNGSEYLDYVKMIMKRGRGVSVDKGNYIGSIAPYGYKKVYIDKSPTLIIDEEESPAIKLMFQLYLDGYGYQRIAKELDTLGYKPRRAKYWNSHGIRDILTNEVYIGKIIWNHRKTLKIMKDGKMIKTRPRQKDYIIREGKHEPIIDEETFHKVEMKMGNNSKENKEKKLVNPLAGLLYCKKCNKVMIYRTYKTCRYPSKPRYLCSTQTKCHTKSSYVDDIIDNVIDTLYEMIGDFEFKMTDEGNRDYMEIYENRIRGLKKALAKLEEKQNDLYDLLENKIYSRDVFTKRNEKLAIQRTTYQKELDELTENSPEIIDYNEKILTFKNIIDLLKHDNVEAETKNYLLSEIIERIDYDNIDGKIQLEVKFK